MNYFDKDQENFESYINLFLMEIINTGFSIEKISSFNSKNLINPYSEGNEILCSISKKIMMTKKPDFKPWFLRKDYILTINRLLKDFDSNLNNSYIHSIISFKVQDKSFEIMISLDSSLYKNNIDKSVIHKKAI
jgi:hypothetical protein